MTAIREARPGAARPRIGRSRAVAYVVIRVTGALLAVLVLGHFALTHVVNDVADTGSVFVGKRWTSAFWLVWDWLMLGAAFAHAGSGMWIVVDDYTADPDARRSRRALLVGTCVTLWVVGSVVVVLGAGR
jgi:succinate dehydrogenase hydrophobic anchor subunit